MKLVLFIFILAFAGLGCNKVHDFEYPVVTITSPEMGRVLDNGQVFHITGNVTDDSRLNQVLIRVTNVNSNNKLMLEVDLSPQSGQGSFNYAMIAEANTHYRLQIVAKDRTKKDTRRVVDFTCP